MAFSLYDATIPSYQQILGSMSGLLVTAETFCAEKKLAPQTIIDARLAEDMLPFAYQVPRSTDRPQPLSGTPSVDIPSWAIAETLAALAAVTPAEVDGFIGRDMFFEFRERRLPFTAENFLLSFSLPNFYFHASTAYDILRLKGARIGKRDFMGRLRLKT